MLYFDSLEDAQGFITPQEQMASVIQPPPRPRVRRNRAAFETLQVILELFNRFFLSIQQHIAKDFNIKFIGNCLLVLASAVADLLDCQNREQQRTVNNYLK